MYINPFVAGVLATIGVEMLLMIAYALIVTRRKYAHSGPVGDRVASPPPI